MNSRADTKDTVIDRIRNSQEKLASLGVVDIGLFGSFVRKEQTPYSDIDLLVEFDPEKHSFDNFIETAFFLEELFGRKVELVTPEALSPHIGHYIMQEVEHVPIAA